MSSNSIGKIFNFTTWGESHGKAIGCVIDGVPSKIPLNDKDLQKYLNFYVNLIKKNNVFKYNR